jgi:hypothetical protein
MLVRVEDDLVVELPDDIGVLILSDPSYGDTLSDMTPHEVNVLIHGILGAFYEDDISIEENIVAIRTMYSSIESASDENKATAMAAVKSYNLKVEYKNVGIFQADELFQFENSGENNLPAK